MTGPSDRFQLVAQPAVEPGYDMITRSTKGPFVDCGAWIQPSPRKQRIYLSVETIAALAEAAGILTAGPVSPAVIARARAEGAVDLLKENLGGDLARVLGRLAAYLDDAELPADPGDGEGADGGS